MAKTQISGSMSMKGYSFKVWLSKNKDNLKLIGTGLLTLATYFATITTSKAINISLTIIAPIVIKMAIDAIDFYITEVKLE